MKKTVHATFGPQFSSFHGPALIGVKMSDGRCVNFHTLPEPRDTPKNFFAFFVGSTQTEKSVARDVKDELTQQFASFPLKSKCVLCVLLYL